MKFKCLAYAFAHGPLAPNCAHTAIPIKKKSKYVYLTEIQWLFGEAGGFWVKSYFLFKDPFSEGDDVKTFLVCSFLYFLKVLCVFLKLTVSAAWCAVQECNPNINETLTNIIINFSISNF